MSVFIFLTLGEESIVDAIRWKREKERKRNEMEVKRMEINRKKEKSSEESIEEAKKIYLGEAETEFHEALSMRTPEEKHLAICQPSPS